MTTNIEFNTKIDTLHNTDKYDGALRSINEDETIEDKEKDTFYKRIPQMLPWVGKEYDGMGHKKILFIGESHYMPYSEGKNKTFEDWNNGISECDLDDDEKGNINTVEIIGGLHNPGPKSKAHGIYYKTEKAILEAGFNPGNKDNMFRYCAYYNYFLRPAPKKGDSIKHYINNEDKVNSQATFDEIIHFLKPDFVYFLSVFAWETYCEHKKKDDIIVDYSPHPSCSWWHRKKYMFNSNGELLSGKEKLIKFLIINKVFE